MLKNKKKNKELIEQEAKRKELMEELIEVQNKINLLYQNLSYIVEPELIDSCIYELNAFQSRYTFILRQVKQEDKNISVNM